MGGSRTNEEDSWKHDSGLGTKVLPMLPPHAPLVLLSKNPLCPAESGLIYNSSFQATKDYRRFFGQEQPIQPVEAIVLSS